MAGTPTALLRAGIVRPWRDPDGLVESRHRQAMAGTPTALLRAGISSLVEQSSDVLVILSERIRAGTTGRLLGRIGQEDRASHLPVGAIRFPTARPGRLRISTPVIGHDVAGNQTVGEWLVDSFAGDPPSRPLVGIDTVELLISRHAAISETEIQPTLGREPALHRRGDGAGALDRL